MMMGLLAWFTLSAGPPTPVADAGLRLVADVNKASRVCLYSCGSPSFLGVTDAGVSLMILPDPAAGSELHASRDGGPAELIYDLRPGGWNSQLSSPTPFGGQLVFASMMPRGLMVTDGTTAGTRLVLAGEVGDVVRLGDSLLVMAWNDGIHGRELHALDGLDATPRLLLDSQPGALTGAPTLLGSGGGRAFFAITRTDSGREMWVTDGTAAGTRMVADLAPGPSSSHPFSGRWSRGWLYFLALTPTLALYRTDGTPGGVQPWGARDFTNAWVSILAVVDEGVFLSEDYPCDECTFSSQSLVKPGQPVAITNGSFARRPSEILDWNNAAWGMAASGASSCAVMQPVVTGTTLSWTTVRQLSGSFSDRSSLVSWDGALYASCGAWLERFDGSTWSTEPLPPSSSGYTLSTGDALYIGDSTRLLRLEGPGRVASLWNAPDWTASSDPHNFTPLADSLLFVASSEYAGRELMRLGPEGQVGVVADLTPGPGDSDFTRSPIVAGGRAFMSVNRGLLETRGTPASTAVIGAGLFNFPTLLAAAPRRLLFSSSRPASSLTSLWSYSPAEGTFSQLAALDSYPELALETPEGAYFIGAGSDGKEPWFSDGSPAGTRVLADVTPGPSSSGAATFAALGQRVFFSAWTPEKGRELWMHDPIGGQTTLVADVNPGPASARPTAVVAVGESLYFWADDGVHGSELWRWSADTGPALVADLAPGSTGSTPAPDLVRVVGPLLYFVTPGDRPTLYRLSPGAPPAPVMAGLDGNSYLEQVGGLLVFDHARPDVGLEPWVLRPGADVPELRADLNPGPGPSSPRPGRVVGRTHYFAATGALVGNELWAATVDATPPRITPVLSGTRRGSAFVSDVTVTFLVEDDESRVVSTRGCEARTVTEDVAALELVCEAFSEGGLGRATAVVRRDTAPPMLVCPERVEASSLEQVVVAPTATDALDPSPRVIIPPLEDTVEQTLEVLAEDAAGNRSSCFVEVSLPRAAQPPPPTMGCGAATGLEAWVTLALLTLGTRRPHAGLDVRRGRRSGLRG